MEFLKNHNKAEEVNAYKSMHTHIKIFLSLQLSDVSPEGALRMYCEAGEWDKCLELAGKQGSSILAKYVALYAAHLIKSNASLSALQLFTKYGASTNPQNFNIYKRLCLEVYSQHMEGIASYSMYASLRNMLYKLVSGVYIHVSIALFTLPNQFSSN